LETANLSSTSTSFLRNAYARILLTRLMDECAWRLYEQGRISFVAAACGHEAAQVGSALCIEVGKDFTLPYYRDLGVVLTIGMTPYEVFRTYLLTHQSNSVEGAKKQTMLHWGYQKHNMITGAAPVATQILHAAGIAFACKLRKAAAVTVAYCGDGATAEPDFLEGITFAALHQLPAVFICEQNCAGADRSSLQNLSLPVGIEYHRVDGSDIGVVYEAMQAAMVYAREGNGPVLLEMCVTRAMPGRFQLDADGRDTVDEESKDPVVRCRKLLEEQGMWDEEWALQLYERASTEVEQAMRDALRDVG
jgi:2-oxoisovalerate dehydrogenase E1 component alpha subunit